MAGQQRLRLFYIALAAIAIAGVALIWTARSRARSGGTQQIDTTGVAGAEFPGWVIGSDSAPVTVTVYADFQCPACAQFAVLTEPEIRERLVATGQVRWIFHDFPLDGHPNSMPAHLAGACAGEQGKFWEMHDRLYFNQGRWAPTNRPERDFREYAREIGLDLGRYDDCMSSGRYRARMQAMKQSAMGRGVNSTPTFDVGTLRVSGALLYDSLKVLVDRAATARAR